MADLEKFLSLVSPEKPIPFKKRKWYKKYLLTKFLGKLGLLEMYVRIELLKIRVKRYLNPAVAKL
jgi:hypothetical protein